MNQFSYNDFGLFETEKLSVDYICLNLPNPSNLSQAASYFQALGFNCYQKDRQENKSRQEKIGLPSIDRNEGLAIIRHFLPRKARKLFKTGRRIFNSFF